MPAMPGPVADERSGLRAFLAQQQDAFVTLAFGLTDDQARATPTASALSIGGLIKHVTTCQRDWMRRVAAAPGEVPPDERPMAEREAERADDFALTPDETLAQVLERFVAGNAEVLRLFDAAELDTPVPVPRDAPWFPPDVEAWSVRWVVLHLIEELGRHAGQGDIIRESIDGASLYELVAGREGWPETDWLTPFRPPAAD